MTHRQTGFSVILAMTALSTACATGSGTASAGVSHERHETLDTYLSSFGEPHHMEILADGRSVLVWDSTAETPSERQGRPQAESRCSLRIVVQADNTVSDSQVRNHADAGCPFAPAPSDAESE